MSTTLVISPPALFPDVFVSPIVSLASAPAGPFYLAPDLELVSCAIHASSTKVDSCEFLSRYGNLKLPAESDFSVKIAQNLAGQWVQVGIPAGDDQIVIFTGIVESQSQIPTGNASQVSGEQHWIASGPMRLLDKSSVAYSQFYDGSVVSTVGWVPDMNSRDKRGMLVGNRSDSQFNNFYFYGGSSIWTHRQYVDYLLYLFNLNSQYTFQLAGQIDILDNLQTTIRFQPGMTVQEMLRDLIPLKYGIDFQIVPLSDGTFDVIVFSLSTVDQTFGSVTLPKNPVTITLEKTNNPSLLDVRIVDSRERRVDHIQVMGKRIVVCGTLQGADLAPKWKVALEVDYTAGGSLLNADDADEYRKRERFREVFQHIGVADGFDASVWSYWCEDDGTLSSGTLNHDLTFSYQSNTRETLSFLPMQEGFDYATVPPTDNTAFDAVPDYKPPIAWVYDQYPDNGASPRHVQCEHHGISVHAPKNDWGLFLHASPNHILGANHFGATNTNHDPKYDYESAVLTIAVESDHRVQLSADLSGLLFTRIGDGSVKTIYDEGAELWVIRAGTVVDVADDGTLKSTSADLITRDDRPRLAAALAGAMARYALDRSRAVLQFKGFMPWSFLTGAILQVTQAGDDLTNGGAVVTSVEWILSPSPMTIVKTGYA